MPIDILEQERKERQAKSPGLCMEELAPDDTDFVIWCDLKDGHEGAHMAWDTAGPRTFIEPEEDWYCVRPAAPYQVMWPLSRPATPEAK